MGKRSAALAMMIALGGLGACGGDEEGGSGGSGGSTDAGTGGSSGSAGGGTAGSGATAGAGGTSGSAGSGTGGSAGAKTCDPSCAAEGFTCCEGICANTNNDILNCGGCGNACGGTNPFCDQGTCATAPCDLPSGTSCQGADFCCGLSCCGPNQLCCDVPGPVAMGPTCQNPTEFGTCPIGCTQCKCASPDTLIATPSGTRRIVDLAVGDLVYSVDQGRMAAVPLRSTQRVPAPNHVVRRIELASGEVVEMSGDHPTADGRTFAEIGAGDRFDGVEVVAASTVVFRHPFTVDVLPDSDTGTYWAGGVLVGSTMAPRRAVVSVAPSSR